MNARELRKWLKDHGFEEVSSRKHVKFRHPDGRWTVVSKGDYEVGRELPRQIEKQVGEKIS